MYNYCFSGRSWVNVMYSYRHGWKKEYCMCMFRNLRQALAFLIVLFFSNATVFGVRRLPTTMLRPPRLTIVIVVDSFGYHYMQKLMPYLGYGLKVLLDKGVVYTNAYWPHGTPSTGPGHAALNTGAYGKDSGIACNSWFDQQGNKIECDDDAAQDAAVFSPDGLYDYGKSPRNIMVSGVSDSFAMQSQPCAKTKVFAISLKSRASIGMVGKDRKSQPIWFDPMTGLMTSSKYYMDALPDWVGKFNKTNKTSSLKSFKWDLLYPADSDYYCCFKGLDAGESARSDIAMIGHDIVIDRSSKNPFSSFEKTPIANQMLFDCAKSCIKANLSCNRDDRMMLWLSLSPLDKLAHVYGPSSLEVIDLIYQLDCQLQGFIHFVDQRIKRSDVLFVLTADHGMGPIPECLVEQGYPAFRSNTSDIEKKIDEALTKNFAGTSIKARIKTPHLYFSKEFTALDKKQKTKALALAKDFLLQDPSIKNAWTNAELDALVDDGASIESFFKNQRFPGRSGDLLIQTAPFCQLTKYTGGTTHEGPYEPNTHVPLIIYRHQFFERKIVNTKVSMLQLANTIAHIAHIPKAAASTCKILPGLFPEEQDFVL